MQKSLLVINEEKKELGTLISWNKLVMCYIYIFYY